MKDHCADTIVLRAPKRRASIPVLRVVIGGVAARHGVSVDQLDDLQLAVEMLVVEERSYSGDLVLEIRVDERGLRLSLEGLCNPEVRSLLQSQSSHRPSPHIIDVRMLLEALVDSYALQEGGSEFYAVQFEKWTS